MGQISERDDRRMVILLGVVLVFAAAGMAFTAMDHVRSWNDGSRLATVEALVDHGTFAIDNSVFHKGLPVEPPEPSWGLGTPIWFVTLDKLYIDGRYYSDKSPVPAVLMAGIYAALQKTTGITARDHPSTFIYWMTVLTSGLAYVAIALGCFLIGRTAGLSPWMSAALTISLGLCTTAWPYMRQVNNHILLLACSVWMCWALFQIARCWETSQTPPRWLYLVAGFFAGLGYTIDLGTGPVLLASAGLLVLARWPGMSRTTIFVLVAGCWVLVHHGLNYIIAGTFFPSNANPEYFDYPGSSFDRTNITGVWNHSSIGAFLAYALDVLFGRKGFIVLNPPMWVFLVGGVMLLWTNRQYRPEILFAYGASAATWLLYAALSTNYAGVCASIRWYVPLLGPGFMVIALFLREFRSFWWAFVLLSIFGGWLGWRMWLGGPWMKTLPAIEFWIAMAGIAVAYLFGLWLWWRGEFTAEHPFGMLPSVRRVPEGKQHDGEQ